MNTNTVIDTQSSKWPSRKLSELGILHCGQSPSSKDVNASGVGTVYITGPEQWDGHRVHVNKWTTSPKRIVPDGCVFITVKGSGVGKIFPGIAGAIGRDVYAFQPSAEHSAKYIEYALKFTVQDILRNAVGDIPGISKSHILDHEVLVPPLDQQKRIVAEIEKQFSRLDESVANLKRVKANLKRYKAAVLKAAVEGRLVETEAELARREGRDYETGTQLLQRILETRRSQWKGKGKYKEPAAPDTTDLPELPEGWVWATLDQIGQEGRPIIYGIIKPGPHDPNGVPYVRVTEMKDGFVDLANLKKAAPARAAKFARATLAAGDILISKDGTIGRVAVVPPELAGGNITQHVMRVPVHKLMRRGYVVWAIRSDLCQRWLTGETKGVALRGVNVEDFRRLPVPVPPGTEQERIAAEVERRLSLVREIEAQIDANLQRSERMRQSILRMAFSGELVIDQLEVTGRAETRVAY